MRTVWRRRALLAGCLVALTGALFAVVTALGGDDRPAFERAGDVGRDPFLEGAARVVPIKFRVLRDISRAADDGAAARDSAEESQNRARVSSGPGSAKAPLADNPRQRERRIEAVITAARRHKIAVAAPPSPAGAPLYGGSGRDACDKPRLKRFFANHRAEAAAWAWVHGIKPAELPEFLDALTGGWLLTDTEVINHGYADGRATPRITTLEAGTAVLVDHSGIPRVRCICGNPLRPVGAAPHEELLVVDFEAVERRSVLDSSPSQYRGRLRGRASVADGGRADRALLLGGTESEGVDFGGILDRTGSITVEAWAKSTAAPRGWDAVVSNWSSQAGYWLGGSADPGGFEWWIDSATARVDTGLVRGRWHHLAGTFDASTGELVLYVDGVARAREHHAGGASVGSDALRFGAGGGTFSVWRGLIDDVRVWSVARSARAICTDAGGRTTGSSGGCARVKEPGQERSQQ